jgi:hypothetical protein
MKRISGKFASDDFFTENGKLDVCSEKPLTVAFIGGSLTEGEVDYEGTSLRDGRFKWANLVIKFFEGLFPLRAVKAVNAGLGGTESDYGSVRFQRDVLSHKPDIVFIEFSCNDRPISEAECEGASKIKKQVYLESMIRQCMEAEKIPVIVYMHVPMPLEGNMLRFYRQGCVIKDEVLDYYGIKAVDAMAEFMREYDPSQTLRDHYLKHYPLTQNGSFDVHPRASGYKFFATAMINALIKNADTLLRPFKMREEPYCKSEKKTLALRYNYLPASSERISYKGNWKLYTAKDPYVCDDPETLIRADKYVRAHQFPDGVMQSFMPKSASFTFETDAVGIYMPHVSAKAGCKARVLCNGEPIGTFTCRSPWHGMNYLEKPVWLPMGKKTVTVEVEDGTEEARVFRFGYIVEVRGKAV